jgi:hypothetical protein
MYQQSKDKAEFLLVYIREAHPSDGRQIPQNIKEGVIYASPKTIGERAAVARDCLSKLKLGFPCVLDNMKDATERAYQSWPDRITVVDLDGKLAYYGERGPGGFKPKLAEEALKALIANGGKVQEK